MKLFKAISILLVLASSQSFAQSLEEQTARAHIKHMHSMYLSYNYNSGILARNENLLQDIDQHLLVMAFIKEIKPFIESSMTSLNSTVDQLLIQCQSEEIYSACTSNNCRTQAIDTLESCMDSSSFDQLSSSISSTSDLYSSYLSEKVTSSLIIKTITLESHLRSIELGISTFLYSQGLLKVGATSGEIEDQRNSLKSGWALTSNLLGCDDTSTTMDAEFSSFAATAGFVELACQLSEIGMRNAVVTPADVATTLDPNLNIDQLIEKLEATQN